MTIHMDGETYNIAQKKKHSLAQYDSELFTGGPPGETKEQKIARGKAILRKERSDDPGSGSLGLNIRMDGDSLSVAQKPGKNDDPDGNLGMTIHMDGETYNIAQKKTHSLS